MSKENPENMADVAALMRDLKGQLEKIMTETIGTFEETSGFIVEDIEIHRTVADTMTSDTDAHKTKIAGITLTVRL